MERRLYLAIIAALVWTIPIDGQMAHRLKGSIRTTAGVPLAGAAVRADAITGFRGEPFAGGKEQTTTSLPTGEWNITNLESGHHMLKPALDLIAAGKMEDASQALTAALGPETPDDTRVAAGEMALITRQHALARTLFDMVLQKQPKHARAKVGQASAALMALQWEAAGKIIWDARDLAPKEQRPALAAAIDDLRAIARVQ
jgi:hypothetical protein